MYLLTGLPADTLQGHRERFHEQFHRYIQEFSNLIKAENCILTVAILHLPYRNAGNRKKIKMLLMDKLIPIIHG